MDQPFLMVVSLFGAASATIDGFWYSIASAVNGEQVATVVSALIGVVGIVIGAWLTAYLSRARRR